LRPSLALFENHEQRLESCRDLDTFCDNLIHNHNRITHSKEDAISSESKLLGLRSAVEELGGAQQVFDFDSHTGLYQKLVQRAAELPTLFPELQIPVLSQLNGNDTVELTSGQISCLLSNALLLNVTRIPLPIEYMEGDATSAQIRSLFHIAATKGQNIPHYGSLSWHLVLDSGRRTATERCKALLIYLREALLKQHQDDHHEAESIITFRRVILDNDVSFLQDWLATHTNKSVAAVSFFNGGVEHEPTAAAMVDFANEDLHVGAIWPCATQEEILFSIHPECFAGLLFCQTMARNEAICISGVRAYCTTTGFQHTFAVTGLSDDKKTKTILAMDASISEMTTDGLLRQCVGPDRDRDIWKAATAFSSIQNNNKNGNAIATGHWGCGAFGGNVYVKFLVQLIAASLTGNPLVYCLVGQDSDQMERDLQAIHNGIQQKDWGPLQVYSAMDQYEMGQDMRAFVMKTFTADSGGKSSE